MDNIKKLKRNTQNKVIGGVCSGLGEYFGIEPIIFRLVFVALLLFGFGAGFIIYLILWLLMPAGIPTQSAESVQDAEVVSEKKDRGSIIGGGTLILIGLFFLLRDYIPQIRWNMVWPVILIVVGIFLIIPISTHKKS